MMLTSIDHVNLVVKDMQKVLRFYCDVLGFKVTKEVTISGDWVEEVVGLKDVTADVVFVDLLDGPRIELIQYRSPQGAILSENQLPNTHGIRHIAFRVTDMEGAIDKLTKANIEFVGKLHTVPVSQVTFTGDRHKSIIYFRDPEGNLLELCCYSTVE